MIYIIIKVPNLKTPNCVHWPVVPPVFKLWKFIPHYAVMETALLDYINGNKNITLEHFIHQRTINLTNNAMVAMPVKMSLLFMELIIKRRKSTVTFYHGQE